MPESLDTLLRTGWCLLILPPALIARSAAAVLLALMGAAQERIDRQYFRFARFCLRLTGTKLEVRGLERVKPGQSYVVVPNHESALDPVALVAALDPLRVRFVIKQQIIRIPIFGRALLLTGNVMVERTNTQGDVHRIQRSMAERSREVSMLFYAEGTRSRRGALQPFKKGAFATAIEHRLPILPVGHAGSFRIWTPEKLRIRRMPLVVEVGEPIAVDALRQQDRDALRDRTYEAVQKLRSEARARVRALGSDPGGVD